MGQSLGTLQNHLFFLCICSSVWIAAATISSSYREHRQSWSQGSSGLSSSGAASLWVMFWSHVLLLFFSGNTLSLQSHSIIPVAHLPGRNSQYRIVQLLWKWGNKGTLMSPDPPTAQLCFPSHQICQATFVTNHKCPCWRESKATIGSKTK